MFRKSGYVIVVGVYAAVLPHHMNEQFLAVSAAAALAIRLVAIESKMALRMGDDQMSGNYSGAIGP